MDTCRNFWPFQCSFPSLQCFPVQLFYLLQFPEYVPLDKGLLWNLRCRVWRERSGWEHFVSSAFSGLNNSLKAKLVHKRGYPNCLLFVRHGNLTFQNEFIPRHWPFYRPSSPYHISRGRAWFYSVNRFLSPPENIRLCLFEFLKNREVTEKVAGSEQTFVFLKVPWLIRHKLIWESVWLLQTCPLKIPESLLVVIVTTTREVSKSSNRLCTVGC